MRHKISACITAGNEESNIRRCLQSVTWADEIIVVDSFSTDRTPEICREYTDRVYKHRWMGYIGQKNLAKDLATHEWVLFLDADEEVSPALRDEILHAFERGDTTRFAAFEFPRMVWFLGRWITHGDWYPDTKLRLYRKNLGECCGSEPHDRMMVDGPCKRLQAPLYHYTYTCIRDQLETLNKFSTITALSQFKDGRKFNSSLLLVRPVLRFLRGYLFRLGFLDGLPGLIIATTSAFGVSAKYAKLWELERQAKAQRSASGSRVPKQA